MPHAPSYLLYGENKYYRWARRCGYPNVDIIDDRDQDGTWSLVEYLRSPVVPSLTPWNYILRDITEPLTEYMVRRFCEMLDLKKKEYRAMMEMEERLGRENYERALRLEDDLATRATKLISHNPDLMERIAKNGAKELDTTRILAHVPRHQQNGLKGVELL
jgi:hypothetical protein